MTTPSQAVATQFHTTPLQALATRFRTCAVTGLAVNADSERLIKANAVAAVVASLVFYYVVGRVYRARSFAGPQWPESPELLLLMAAMVLVPIGAMVLIGLAARFASNRTRERRTRVRG